MADKRPLRTTKDLGVSSDSSPEKSAPKKAAVPRTATKIVKTSAKLSIAAPKPQPTRKGIVPGRKPGISASSDCDTSEPDYNARLVSIENESKRMRECLSALSASSVDGVVASPADSDLAKRHLEAQRKQNADAASPSTSKANPQPAEDETNEVVVQPEVARQSPSRLEAILKCPWSEIESAVPASNRRLCESFDDVANTLAEIANKDGISAEIRVQIQKVRDEYAKVFREALEKLDVLRGQNHTLGMAKREQAKSAAKRKAPQPPTAQEPAAAGTSYAEMVRSADVWRTVGSRQSRAPRSSQLVTPAGTNTTAPAAPASPKTWAIMVKGEELSSDQVKEKLLAEVSRKVKGVRVTAVRKTRDGGVMLETSTSEDIEKLRASEEFTKAGLVVHKAPQPLHKVLVINVPKTLTVEELKEEIVQSNFDQDVGAESFAEEVRILPRSANTNNLIIEVTDRVRRFWRGIGRLQIGWSNHYFRELSGVETCFKCAGHGHSARFCTEAERLCYRCGTAGHVASACTNEESCRNCRLAQKTDNHNAKSSICPFYGRALAQQQNRTNRYQE